MIFKKYEFWTVASVLFFGGLIIGFIHGAYISDSTNDDGMGTIDSLYFDSNRYLNDTTND